MSENTEVMTTGISDADIDRDWDEAETSSGAQEETTTESQPAETPADPDVTQSPVAEGEQKVDQPELYILKNRDQTRQVTLDEMRAMAQKNWDYDDVKTERDQLRQYKQEADPALALVKDYAARMGMDIPHYLDYCREQELRMGGKTEAEAKNIVAQEKREANLQAREQAVAAKERAQTSAETQARLAEMARRKSFDDFSKAYPDVKPEAIPKEVWDAVGRGQPLISAFTMHENRRLQGDIAKLQADLAAERQNKINQANSPGSLGGASVNDMDELDRLWEEDD